MDFDRPVKLRGDEDEYRLADVLATLKERGCTILVAGKVPAKMARPVSRRLFGHPEKHRERMFIRLHQTGSLAEWFPDGVDLDDPGVRVVDCVDPGRSAAEEESGGMRWNSKFDPEETPALSRHSDVEGCLREMDSLVARAGGMAPAQLRVGVFSLNALDGITEMIDVVSSISSTVVEHDGMVHFHYQGLPEGKTVQTLRDYVDALLVIQKSGPDEPVTQQWRIQGYGETPWIPLSRHE